jgi:penicillin amidase
MARIHSDVVSLLGRTIIKDLESDLARAAAKDAALEGIVESLLAWDGNCSERSVEATLFHVLHQRLIINILEPELGKDLLSAYAEIFNQSLVPLEHILRDPQSPWFKISPRFAVVQKSLRETADFLSRELGPKREKWSWGRLHTLTLGHQLGENKWLAPFFSIGPTPSAGDGVTISMGFYSHAHPYRHIVGPTLRMIIEPGNWQDAGFILASGQSGHPFSSHYRDQFPLWRSGQYIPLAYSPETMTDWPRLVLTALP